MFSFHGHDASHGLGPLAWRLGMATLVLTARRRVESERERERCNARMSLMISYIYTSLDLYFHLVKLHSQLQSQAMQWLGPSMEGILALLGDKKELHSRCFRQTTRPLQDAAFYCVVSLILPLFPTRYRTAVPDPMCLEILANARRSESF